MYRIDFASSVLDIFGVAIMTNKHSKHTAKFVLLSLFVFTLSALPALSGAVSITWGNLGKYASPIYDEEIKLSDSKPTVDVTYPQQVNNIYICIYIFVCGYNTVWNNESENKARIYESFFE